MIAGNYGADGVGDFTAACKPFGAGRNKRPISQQTSDFGVRRPGVPDLRSDERRLVLDLTREVKPPFDPDEVVGEFCQVLKAYGITRVVGDSYGGAWPTARFRTRGVVYEVAS
jgi:hypothetical protein